LFLTALVLSWLASGIAAAAWVGVELHDRRVPRQVADCVPREAERLRQARAILPSREPVAVGETIWDGLAEHLAWRETEARRLCGVPEGSTGTRTWESLGEADLLAAAIVLLPFALLAIRRWTRWLMSTSAQAAPPKP
jgi:hypothetical protein